MEFYGMGRDIKGIGDFTDGPVQHYLLQHFGFPDGKLVTVFICQQLFFRDFFRSVLFGICFRRKIFVGYVVFRFKHRSFTFCFFLNNNFCKETTRCTVMWAGATGTPIMQAAV